MLSGIFWATPKMRALSPRGLKMLSVWLLTHGRYAKWIGPANGLCINYQQLLKITLSLDRALAKADKTGGSMNSNLVGSAQTIVTWIIFLSKIHIFQRILVVLKGENEYTLATHSNVSNSFK
jgi:hypothetical protein